MTTPLSRSSDALPFMHIAVGIHAYGLVLVANRGGEFGCKAYSYSTHVKF
jgi:hypothetical protein